MFPKGEHLDLHRRHPNLWAGLMVAVFCHFWIAWAFLSGFPKGDLTANSYLFTIVPPSVWAAFSIATGVGMLYGIFVGPYIAQQVSAGWGSLMACALGVNGLATVIRSYAEGHNPPLAVKMIFGFAVFYLCAHVIFATEPPENPATHRHR